MTTRLRSLRRWSTLKDLVSKHRGLANADVTLRHTDRIGIAVHFRNMAALCADNRGCSLTAIRHIRCFSMPRQTVPNGDAPPSNLSVHYPRHALPPITATSASIKYITTAIHLESVKARACAIRPHRQGLSRHSPGHQPSLAETFQAGLNSSHLSLLCAG